MRSIISKIYRSIKSLDVRNKNHNFYNVESLVYTLFAVLSVCTVFYLFYYSPVNYAILAAEDYIAEYGTSVSFGLAGVILLGLSFIRGPKIRRTMWVLIGVIALAIAGEEISWGQRILYVDTPSVLSEHNIKNELNLHNLAVIAPGLLHVVASYLILIYLVFSLIVVIFKPSLGERHTTIGLPLIQIKLVPIFLLVPYFFILHPAIYPIHFLGEIGELFLGIAVLMWAVDLCLESISSKRFNSFTSYLGGY